ncbi:hypothetical protein D3C71_1699740 [compost metagenome]
MPPLNLDLLRLNRRSERQGDGSGNCQMLNLHECSSEDDEMHKGRMLGSPCDSGVSLSHGTLCVTTGETPWGACKGCDCDSFVTSAQPFAESSKVLCDAPCLVHSGACHSTALTQV